MEVSQGDNHINKTKIVLYGLGASQIIIDLPFR